MRRPLQFHIPGHKTGLAMDPEFREFMGERALSIDLINIGPLDDLHHPTGIIDQAQKLAAQAFGADYTFFSVQGTSGAIMAMIMSVVGPGDEILVPRNIHTSVLSAIILSGARPFFLQPEVDLRLGIAHGVRVESVAEGLKRHPNVKAVLLINPTYFGVATDLRSIVKLAHDRGVVVLVDEAHGVHTHFHEQLPPSAMQAGCDLAATSVHKLGGSLTQSSVLNVKEGLVRARHVHSILSLLTTTSTSYILLASLDAARRQLATRGHELLDRAIAMAQSARRRLNEIPGIYCFGEEILASSATFALDPLKLTIRVAEIGLSGYEVEVILREKYNIEVELSDLYNVLCVISFGDTEENIAALISAIAEIANRELLQHHHKIQIVVPSTPVLAMSPREAFYAETEVVQLRDAIGRIIADVIKVYPPGIPILLPGEIVTADNVEFIEENLRAGLPVQGPDDPTIETVRVVKER
ncbi:arginine decarboxylase [Sulfoacidibacillus thermotolerans]|uniref:Arginine decarboxylase n=2 Tax=Sulfoacidibacillus thermotolerans TaxID=1765684 RepID=A0A2U3DCM4_SULT2|nr:arginine decarboxylase [Sulfoacidibacillus thermotolerans]